MAKPAQRLLPSNRSVRNILDPVHIGPPLGVQYRQMVMETLGKLSRRKLAIMAAVAAGLVLGIVAAVAMSKRYTAEAFIQEGLAASESVAAHAGASDRPVSFDASLLVETRSQLLQSHQLARQVVQDLGLDRLRPVVGQGRLSSWLQREFNGGANSLEYQEDMAATKLMRGLSVKTAPRVYQIALRYTAKDPELATAITNAFVVEFLRTNSLQKLSGQRAAAQAALSESLATLGDKHPKVREARMKLTSTERLIKEELSRSPDDIRKSAGENITFAEASVIPSSPNPPLIFTFAVLAGLAAGIGRALWLEHGPQPGRPRKPEPTDDRRPALSSFLNFPVPISATLRITRRITSRAVRRRVLRQNG